MNKNRRAILNRSCGELEQAISLAKQTIDSIKFEEENCLENLPENMQDGDRAVHMEDGISYLEDAISNLEDAIKNVEEAMN